MTRVMFMNASATLGGAERSLLDLAGAMKKEQPDWDLHCTLLQEGPLGKALERRGIRCHVVPLPGELRTLGESGALSAMFALAPHWSRTTTDVFEFMSRLSETVRKTKPDLVHSNGIKAHLLAAALFRDIPGVLHARDFLKGRFVTRKLMRGVVRPKLLVIANSKKVANEYAQELPSVPVRAIYNAVDTAHFTPEGPKLDLARVSDMATASHAFAFGMVATYARWKGHEVFLHAAARVRERNPADDIRFYVVGGPVYETEGSQLSLAELRALRSRYGLEDVLGFVPFQQDPAAAFRALDVVVHASAEPEPFGRSVVEAMACGRPCVIANNGGVSELFRDGETGIAFQSGSAQSLSQGMERLYRSQTLRRDVAERALAHARNQFALPRLAREVISAYQDVL